MKKDIKPFAQPPEDVVSEAFITAVNGGDSKKDEAAEAKRDGYGRDVSKWISVEGKLRPHP